MPRQNPESQFKSYFLSLFDNWHTKIEFGRGGSPGVPDLLLGVTNGILPTEIKIGSIQDGVLWTSAVRPSQIVWHRQAAEAGYDSVFIVGVQESTKWRSFIFNGILANQWDSVGFAIGKDCFELDSTDLQNSIDQFLWSEMD